MLIVGCAVLLCWLIAVFMFKITKGIIHLLLIIAIIAIVVHLLGPR